MADNDWTEGGPTEFVRTRIRVEAIRIGEENVKDCAIWCGGKALEIKKTKASYVQIADEQEPVLIIPTLDGLAHGYLGEWLIKDQDGRFLTMSTKEFKEEYQLPTPAYTAADL